MSLRLHERIPADIEVHLKNLSRPSEVFRGWILDISESGVAVLVAQPMLNGDLVLLDVADCELFGHVIYVREDKGSFRAGVAVEQVLLGRSDLSRLFTALSA